MIDFALGGMYGVRGGWVAGGVGLVVLRYQQNTTLYIGRST